MTTLANKVNLNPTTGEPSPTPAPPSGQQCILWQDDAGTPTLNVSAVDPLMEGDSGSGGLAGNAPQPAAGDTAAGKFLKADATWAVPPGTGIGTFTPEAVTFSGTSGTLGQTPIVGGFFALFRNGILMTTSGSSAIQTYSQTGTAITLSVTAGGDSFYALYYH